MLIDCDVHPQLHGRDELTEYVPEAFRDRWVSFGTFGTPANYPTPSGGRRLDSFPTDGGPSGSDPALFESQLLGEAEVDYAMLLVDVAGNSEDPDMNAALRTAMNEWQVRKWLTEYNVHGRYRGAITIPLNNVEGSIAEIEKWAGHPSFVQVLGNPKTQAPLGQRVYHPIWEACARKGLPLALHGNSGGLPSLNTAVGYVSYYAEVHAVAEATVYVTHLLSFICEGVFDKYPDFKVVFVEGGFSWIGPLIWRLEKAWDLVRAEFPGLKRRPSDYLYDNMRFTSQPIEEPDRKQDLSRLYDIVDAEKILMFSTDYPHWDFDNPKRALPRLPEGASRRIRYQNAAELYGIAVS